MSEICKAGAESEIVERQHAAAVARAKRNIPSEEQVETMCGRSRS